MANDQQHSTIPILGIDTRILERQAQPGLCSDISNIRPYGPTKEPHWIAVPDGTDAGYGTYTDVIRSFYHQGYIFSLADNGSNIVFRILQNISGNEVLYETPLLFLTTGDNIAASFANMGKFAVLSVLKDNIPEKIYFLQVGDIATPQDWIIESVIPDLPLVKIFNQYTTTGYSTSEVSAGTYSGLEQGLYYWRYAWRLKNGNHIMHSQPFSIALFDQTDTAGNTHFNELLVYFEGFTQLKTPSNMGFWDQMIDGITVFLSPKLDASGTSKQQATALQDILFYDIARFDFTNVGQGVGLSDQFKTFNGKSADIITGLVMDTDPDSHHSLHGNTLFGYSSRLFLGHTHTDFYKPQISPFNYSYYPVLLLDGNTSNITISILTAYNYNLFTSYLTITNTNLTSVQSNTFSSGGTKILSITATISATPWTITLTYNEPGRKPFSVTLSASDIDNTASNYVYKIGSTIFGDGTTLDYSGNLIPYSSFSEPSVTQVTVRTAVTIQTEDNNTFERITDFDQIIYPNASNMWIPRGLNNNQFNDVENSQSGVLWYPDYRAKSMKIFIMPVPDIQSTINITTGSRSLTGPGWGIIKASTIIGSSGTFQVYVSIAGSSATGTTVFDSSATLDQIAYEVAYIINSDSVLGSRWKATQGGTNTGGDQTQVYFESISGGITDVGISYSATSVNISNLASATFSYPYGQTTVQEDGTGNVGNITVSFATGVLSKSIIISIPPTKTPSQIETLIVNALNADSDFATYYTSTDNSPILNTANTEVANFEGDVTLDFGTTGTFGTATDFVNLSTNYHLVTELSANKMNKVNGAFFYLYGVDYSYRGRSASANSQFHADNTHGSVVDPASIDNTLQYEENNRVQVSDVNSPISYPSDLSYSIGNKNAQITAFAANALPVSQGQFGQYPVFVFLNNPLQIWALEESTDPTILFARISPISVDQGVVGKESVVNIGRTIAFLSKGKIYILNETTLKPISEPIDGLLTGNEKLGYYNDGVYDELWVAALSKTYVYSFVQQKWFTISRIIDHFINADNVLWSFRSNTFINEEDKATSIVPVSLVMEPVHFGLPDQLKRIWALYVRGQLSSNGVDPLYSITMETTGQQFTTNTLHLRPRHRSDYSFTLAIKGNMTPANNDYLYTVDAEFDTRYPERQRATK